MYGKSIRYCVRTWKCPNTAYRFTSTRTARLLGKLQKLSRIKVKRMNECNILPSDGDKFVCVKSGSETCGGPLGTCIHAEQEQLQCYLTKSLFKLYYFVLCHHHFFNCQNLQFSTAMREPHCKWKNSLFWCSPSGKKVMTCMSVLKSSK